MSRYVYRPHISVYMHKIEDRLGSHPTDLQYWIYNADIYPFGIGKDTAEVMVSDES
jgi:hypothetical protein